MNEHDLSLKLQKAHEAGLKEGYAQGKTEGYLRGIEDAAKHFEDMTIDCEWYPLDIAEELKRLSRGSR